MKAGVVKAFIWDGNKIQLKNIKNMKKILYSIVVLTSVLCSACEPTEIEGGTPDRTITAETFEYTVTPIMEDGKATNRVLLETQSPVTCSWNNEVATVVGNSVWTDLFHTGENEITVHGINQDGSTFDKSFKVNVETMKYPVDELYGILTNNSSKTWVFKSYGVTWGDPTEETDFSMYGEDQVVGWCESLGIGKEHIGSTVTFTLKGTKMVLRDIEGKETEGTFSFVRVAEGESVSPSCSVAKFMTIGTFIPFANPWWGPAKSFSSLVLMKALDDKLIFTFNDGNIWCWVFEPQE